MERMVQCLSPVHIGTGQDLEPFDYIVDGQRYIRVHLDAVLERMTTEQADHLAAWVGERADRIVELEERRAHSRERTQLNERISEIRREMQLLKFPGTDATLKEALRTDAALERYHGDRGFERSLQVREQAKDADETPCIPGSSLKGALRTALAFVALEEMEQDERKKLGRAIEREVRTAEDAKKHGKTRQVRRLQEHIGQEIEQAVFRCGKKQRDGQIDYRDIHYDLMRAISISDTYDAQAELIVPQIYTFVEQRTQDGSTQLDAQAPLIAEAHAPGNIFRLRLRVDGGLLRAISLRAISQNGRRDEWINFEQRVRRAFGPEVARLLPEVSDEQLEQAVIDRLEAAVRRFAKAIVVAEQRWEESHGHGSTNALQDFYNRLDDLIRKGLVPLRLGWGSHFLATTLLLVLKEVADWRPILERCFRAFDIGVPPGRHRDKGRDSERQIELDDFPRSRRLVAVGKRPVAPLGWIVLTPTAEELPGPLVEKERLLARTQEKGPGGPKPEGRPTGQPQAGPKPRDPVSEESNRIKDTIQKLGGKGDVSQMEGIVGRIERLSDKDARRECAQQLQKWLKRGDKKSLWKDKKHANTEWRKKLDRLFE